MLESLKDNVLEYQRLSPEEQQKRGILGRLKGVIADFKNPTRNGRFYSEELWDKAFEDPIIKEKLATKTFLGELNHPADRLETEPEKVAICLAETPKKGKDGKLYGIFDILDTPCGKILKTLCDYGCSIGVSSRAGGETDKDFEGRESVIPETFDLQGWDAVLLPAVKEARMTYVTESLNGKTLKQSLNESLENATPEDKKIMTETLNSLNIEYTHENVIDKKDVLKENNIAANDVGANMLEDLQKSLLKQQEQETKILELQEKLSVCYAKETKYEEDIARYKQAILNLSESAKTSKSNATALQSKVDSLTEQLTKKDEDINKFRSINESINNRYRQILTNREKLSESISSKSNDLVKANNEIKSLNEKLESYKQNEDTLKESIENVKKNLTIKTTEYSNKLANSNKIIEQLKATTTNAVNRYIECKATMLGVTVDEIKHKLSNNYTFNDIDRVCESLSKYKVQINKLPFELQKDTKIMVEAKEDPILPKPKFDDEVDNQLAYLAQL